MKSGKKMIVFVVCFFCTCLLFAGGTGESNAVSVDTSKYELHDPRPTLKVLMAPSTNNYNTRPEAAQQEEVTGYHVEYYNLSSQNTEQALVLTVSSGNDYDLIQLNSQSLFSMLMTNGALLPLNDYIDNMAPEFYEVMPEEFWLGVTGEDGNIYGLPYMHPRRTNILSNFIVRMDLVRAAGIEELPTTLSGFYDMLVTLKEYYGDEYIILTGPYFRRYTFNFDLCLSSAFGIYNDWMVDENGKVIYMTEHPRFKDMMAFYEKLMDEGLLDSDFAINTYRDVDERISSGKAIIAFNSEGGVNGIYSALLSAGLTDDDIAFIGPLEGDDGVCTVPTSVFISRYFVVPVNNRGYTAEIIDWAKKKLANQHELTIGIEGVHYVIEEDGYPAPILPIFNDEKDIGYMYLVVTDYDMYAEDWLLRAKKTYYYWRAYEEVTIRANNERPWIFVPSYFALCNTPAYMENNGVLISQLNDYLLQLVSGVRKLDSSFDVFMADQRNEGLEEVRAELQQWYDTHYGNN